MKAVCGGIVRPILKGSRKKVPCTWTFPSVLLAGITCCTENLLAKLELFYVSMICSFAYVNSINLESDIQWNILATKQYPKINSCMIALDYVEVADLLVVGGVLDY